MFFCHFKNTDTEWGFYLDHVASLYSFIPHHLAVKVVIWFLDTYSYYSTNLKDYIVTVIFYLLTQNFWCLMANSICKRQGRPWGRNSPRHLQRFIWRGGREIIFFWFYNLVWPLHRRPPNHLGSGVMAIPDFRSHLNNNQILTVSLSCFLICS